MLREMMSKILEIDSDEDLCKLDKVIRLRRDYLNVKIKLSLKEGDRVSFKRISDGEVVNGVIVEIPEDQEEILTDVDNETIPWRISPSRLKKI